MPPRKKNTRKATPKKSMAVKSTKKSPISVDFIQSENEDGDSVFIVDDFDEHEASEYDE